MIAMLRRRVAREPLGTALQVQRRPCARSFPGDDDGHDNSQSICQDDPVTTSASGEFALSAAELAGFDERGFLVLPSLTTAAEVVALQDIYDRLFEPGAAIGRQDRVELAGRADGAQTLPQILNPDHYAPELRETTAFRNAFAVARQLLGADAEHMGMHAIRKPAHSGAETPWHQDEAYWDPSFDHPAISVWIPLQEATIANGCMSFVPGSHRDEVVEHELINPGLADGLRATDPSAAEDRAVACPLPAGGATVHAGRTLHHAGPNGSDQPRRALIVGFRTTPRWRGDGRSFPWQPAAWYE